MDRDGAQRVVEAHQGWGEFEKAGNVASGAPNLGVEAVVQDARLRTGIRSHNIWVGKVYN